VKIGQESTDCVALPLRNGPELIIAYFACFLTGFIAAPRDTRFNTVELTAPQQLLRPSLYLGQLDLRGHADR
jgi:long-chain acyl-CoA synthetase